MGLGMLIAVNEKGRAIGESHANAKLSDAHVELIRDLFEEGFSSYRTLAEKFGVHKATIADIVNYRRRAQTPADWRPAKRKVA